MRTWLTMLLLLLLVPAGAAAQGSQAWNGGAARALLDYANGIATHGLDPADYELPALRAAIGGADPAALDRAATRSFALIARDLANGRVPAPQRRLSYYRAQNLEPAAVLDIIDRALASGEVPATLDRLAPADPDYRRLRAALAALPAGAAQDRARIRANLERWRWLPRALGKRHLIANIPEYLVRLVDRGESLATHRIVVGKTGTPTPQFSTVATGVIFNPSWTVPQSIIRESVGALVRSQPATARARGYTWTGQGASLHVVQQPGPTNALGQMKIDMPNPLAIFLHDTPSKTLFGHERRAYSHGCVRTDRPFDLAAKLLGGTDWTRERIEATVAARQTVTAPLPAPIPVHIVYLTVRADRDGRLVWFDDIYGLDGELSRALGGPAITARHSLSDRACAAG